MAQIELYERHLVITSPAEWVALMIWYRRRQIPVVELDHTKDEVATYAVISE